jgi:ribosomal protein L7/L12
MVIVPESLRQKTDQPIKEQVEIKKPPKPAKPRLSEQEAMAKVTDLAWKGEQIKAMKLYRETFPVSLQEAKTAIDQVKLGLPLPIPAVRWEDGEELPLAAAEEITHLVAAGQLAEAARLYRITFDTSKVEADTAVEQLLAGKSINVARQTARSEAQETAVRRERKAEKEAGPSRSLVPVVIFFALLILAVLALLILVIAVL